MAVACPKCGVYNETGKEPGFTCSQCGQRVRLVKCSTCDTENAVRFGAPTFTCRVCGDETSTSWALAAEQAPPVAQPPRQGNPVVGALVLLALVVIAFQFCSGSPTSDGSSFSGEVTGFTPVDEANLLVAFTLTNDGDETAKGGCSLRAMDVSGIVGFDFFTSRQKIRPGETVTLRGSIRIEDEGAFRVRRVVARDCEAA